MKILNALVKPAARRLTSLTNQWTPTPHPKKRTRKTIRNGLNSNTELLRSLISHLASAKLSVAKHNSHLTSNTHALLETEFSFFVKESVICLMFVLFFPLMKKYNIVKTFCAIQVISLAANHSLNTLCEFFWFLLSYSLQSTFFKRKSNLGISPRPLQQVET